MEPLYIVKVGGNIIDDAEKINSFLAAFSSVQAKKILVHGGGKLATKLATSLSIPQQLVDGRRITDAETLKIVTMVYAGWINKNIVAKLNAMGCISMGISGADAQTILAHKRKHNSIDYGFVGDIDQVNTQALMALLSQNINIVVAPITQDASGQLLNTNADTVAQEIAKAMSSHFSTSLIYSFEKKGVMRDVSDENSVMQEMNAALFKRMKEDQSIFAGMIPKLDNAFAAIAAGVSKVIIGDAMELPDLIKGKSGTTIS
ncbi:MAG: hypothetical protein RLY46_117 [Bacteroidota bacterium]|jgi:acetylglutamate kinase